MLSTSHRAVGHLDVFFGKMFIQVLCPILNLVIITVIIFTTELYEFLIHFGSYPLSNTLFANTFSHSKSCLLILLIFFSLCCAQSFLFDAIPLLYLDFCCL